MYYPRKHSGSMPAGQARPPRTREGETQSVQAMLIGIMGMMLTKRKMLVSTVPTHGAFTVCMKCLGMDGGWQGGGYATGAQTDPFNAGNTGSFEAFGEGGGNNTDAGLSSATRNRSGSTTVSATAFRVGFSKSVSHPTISTPPLILPFREPTHRHHRG